MSNLNHQPVNQKEVDIHHDHDHQDLPAESDHHLDHDPHLNQYTPGQLKSIRIQGILSILGGVLFHLVLGCFYSWGTISPYVTAYLKSYDSSITLTQMAMVFPFLGIATNASLSFGVKLAEKVGYKTQCFVCGCFVSLAFLICSFVTNYGGFVTVYCLMFGIPSGLAYMLPILCGWRFFPQRRGMVSGIIVGAYGFGSFIFNFVCLAIVNPNNQKPTIEVEEEGKVHKYFGPEVYENVPKMLQILSGCFFALTIISAFLIKFPRDLHLEYIQVNQPKAGQDVAPHSSTEGSVQKPMECPSLIRGIKSYAFLVLVLLPFAGTIFGLFMSNCYKFYGQEMGIDDYMLTVIGSIASASNGCSRYAWAMALDRWGFRRLTALNLIIQAGMAGGMGYLNGNAGGYLVMHAITMGCMGGLFSTFPVISTKIFGPKVGPVIYGIMFFCIGLSNMAAYLIYKFQVAVIGFEGLFWIFFAIICIAWVLNIFVPERGYKWD